jgi:hypothetical protein
MTGLGLFDTHVKIEEGHGDNGCRWVSEGTARNKGGQEEGSKGTEARLPYSKGSKMSSKIAKRQLREMSVLSSAAHQVAVGQNNTGKEKKKHIETSAPKKIVNKDFRGGKLSKNTAKRRRQKAFPLNFGTVACLHP